MPSSGEENECIKIEGARKEDEDEEKGRAIMERKRVERANSGRIGKGKNIKFGKVL